jgi:RNA 2',3'-cyclic 3'-phosphodiesterase
LRAFVAVEVPGSVLDAMVLFQKELSATGADLKLVERQNLHFTIKFLGEIAESTASEAGSRLSRLSLKGADVEVRGAGAFPTPARPRVVWAGVSPESEPLFAPIAHEVIGALEGIGERDDRPFRAHITLARVRSGRNARQLADLLRSSSGRPFGVARLSELKLKSSVLTPAGPIYKNVGVFPLG